MVTRDGEANITDTLKEWSKIDQPSSNRYEEQASPIFSNRTSKFTREYCEEINGPYQEKRIDNRASREEAKFRTNLPILLYFVVIPFLIVLDRSVNYCYDPRRSEKVLYGRLNSIEKYQYHLAKPMTLLNGIYVIKNIYSRMDWCGNWLKEMGSLPYVDVIWKVIWWSSKSCLRYYHVKLNLLAWSALSSPISLAWDTAITWYKSHLSSKALREVLTKIIDNSRIKYNEEGYQVTQSLRHMPRDRLLLAIDKAAALMSDWVQALVNPSTYNFSNDVAQLNVIVFKETSEVYVQSTSIVTYPLVKEARREGWIPEDTYQISNNYVLLPVLRGEEDISLLESTVNLCSSFFTTLAKNLLTWTGKNWEQAEVKFLYRNAEKVLSYTRPKFDNWIYDWIGQVGRNFTGWLGNLEVDNFFINLAKNSLVPRLESMLPKVLDDSDDSVEQNVLLNDREYSRMTNQLLKAWSAFKLAYQTSWYLGWSVLALGHTWWGILLGEKMNWFNNEEDSNVVIEDLQPNPEDNLLQRWGIIGSIDYLSKRMFGSEILVKESSEKLSMIKVTEENLGRLNILTRRLLITCDNSLERVILSKLNFSYELMICLTEVGLSPHDVIQLYFNSFVLPGLNLSLVKGKEVFLSELITSHIR